MTEASEEAREFVSRENQLRFQLATKKIIEQILKGDYGDPMNSYKDFIDICEEIFPKGYDNPILKDILYQRFQMYLQIHILWELGRLRRKSRSARSKN
jgi:hypothetical protein